MHNVAYFFSSVIYEFCIELKNTTFKSIINDIVLIVQTFHYTHNDSLKSIVILPITIVPDACNKIVVLKRRKKYLTGN